MSSRLIAICALLASAAALAQVEKPAGIKIGDGRLHPFFDFEGRYDSAVGYFGSVTNPTLEGDIGLRFRPGLRFDLLGTDTVIQFNGNAEYVFFTGALSRSTPQASRFQTDISLETAFNKTGAVEIQFGDQLVRSDRTNNPAITVAVLSLYNNVHAAAPIHPGGGALEFTPKVAWSVEFFEPLIASTLPMCPAGNPTCQPATASDMNYSNLNAGLGARWRFLPKTAVVFDGTFDYRSYFRPNSPGGSAPSLLMKLQAGMAGLISSKLSVLLLAGYGRDFATVASRPLVTPQTFIMQAELGVLLSELTTFKLGYVRTMQPVPFFGVYEDDRGYLDAKFGIGRFTITGNAAIDWLRFYGSTLPIRQEAIITAGVTPSVAIFSWFQIAAGYSLNHRLPIGTTTPQAGTNFTRHEAMLRLSFTY